MKDSELGSFNAQPLIRALGLREPEVKLLNLSFYEVLLWQFADAVMDRPMLCSGPDEAGRLERNAPPGSWVQ
jgi:hypothetical protein